jgi:hypothetical protein
VVRQGIRHAINTNSFESANCKRNKKTNPTADTVDTANYQNYKIYPVITMHKQNQMH